VSAVKRAKQGTALSFWASKQYAKAFSSWTLGAALRQNSRQVKEEASHMRRRHLSTGVLLHWQGAVTQMQEARQAGSEALQVRRHSDVTLVRHTFGQFQTSDIPMCDVVQLQLLVSL